MADVTTAASAAGVPAGGFQIPMGADLMKFISDLMNNAAALNLQAAQLALSGDANANAAKSQAGLLQAQIAQLQQAALASDRQYDSDMKQYGLSVAKLNYDQRQGQLQGQLSTIQKGLDVVNQGVQTGMANYQQRLGKVDKNLQIAGMLADRKGPQNFYSYNSLLNQLSPDAPGGGSTTVDPYQWTKDLVQPISNEMPVWAKSVNPNPNIAQPFTAEAPTQPTHSSVDTSAIQSTINSLGQPSAAGQAANTYLANGLNKANQNTNPTTPAAAPDTSSGYDLAKVNPGWNLITTGTGLDTKRSDWDPSVKVYGADKNTEITDPNAVINKGGQYWLYKAAGGGKFNTKPSGKVTEAKEKPINGQSGAKSIGPVMVGDSPTGAPTGNEEIATVQTTDPNATLNVQPANGAGLDMQSGGDPAQKATAAISAVTQALDVLKGIVAQMTGEEQGTGEPPMGSQSALDTSAAMGGMDMAHAAGGGMFGVGDGATWQPNGGQRAAMQPNQPVTLGNGQGMFPGGMPQMGGQEHPYRQHLRQMWQQRMADFWPQHAQFLQTAPQWPGMMRMASGGEVGVNNGNGAADYYGTGTTNPTMTYDKYTPEQLGNLPFIKKLLGGNPTPGFQGFGAPISNPSIGIHNFPGMFNLQSYSGLLDTEKDMTQSLLEQGLGLDSRDFFTKSLRAAPGARNWATASYG